MQTVLITGASAGIGYASALALARSGYRVFASMRRPEEADEMRAVAAKEGLALTPCAIDVDDDRSVAEGVKSVIDSAGSLDVFINNAGIVALGAIEDLDIAATRQVFETNFFGALRCFKAVIPVFRRQQHGRLVVVSSQSGRMAQGGLSSYCASKWALEALTEAAAIELFAFGATVSIVEPGGVLSPLQGKVQPFPSGTPYQRIYDRFMAWNAIDYREAARPEDIAAVIVDVLRHDDGIMRRPTDFAGRNIAWRSSLSDERWVELHGSPNDERWEQLWRLSGGVDLAGSGVQTPTGDNP